MAETAGLRNRRERREEEPLESYGSWSVPPGCENGQLGVMLTPYGPVYGYILPPPPMLISWPPPMPQMAQAPAAPAAAAPAAGQQPVPLYPPPGLEYRNVPQPPPFQPAPASVYRRFMAEVIDIIILNVIACLICGDLEAAEKLSGTYSDLFLKETREELVDAIGTLVIAHTEETLLEHQAIFYLSSLVYQTLFVWLFGATIGKLICGIRVARLDQPKVPLISSFLRAFVKTLIWAVASVFLFVGLFRDGRGLSDKVAGTQVVKR